jgi:ribosome-binding factor A
MLSLTDVTLSPDLQHAKIFAAPISKSITYDNCITFLEKHKSKFRRQIADSIRLKYIPDISFFVDDSFEQASKIEELFKKFNNDKMSGM